MRTPSGGYSDPGLQREVRELRKQVDVLSRRKVEMPKPPKPVVSGGGGIIGQATANSSSLRTQGFTGAEFYAWSFADEVGQPLGLNDTAAPGGKGFTAPAGWYSGKVYVGLDIAPQPSPIIIQVNEALSSLAYGDMTYTPGGGHCVHTGTFWLPEMSYPRLTVTAYCETGIPADAVGSCSYYLTRHG